MSLISTLLIGYFAYRLLKKLFAPSQENAFWDALLSLAALMMRADGSISRSELDAFKDFLRECFPGDEDRQLRTLRRLGELRDDPSLDLEAAARIVAGLDYNLRVIVLQMLLRLAYADGSLSPEESALARRIATRIGIRRADFLSILAMFEPPAEQAPSRPYEILGVAPDASEQEIKRAYRSLVKRYHPDLMPKAGEAAKKAATDKFRAIQEAYDTICRERGF